jgi:hypothetical protein
VLGSSMGGLISLYAFFCRPEVFGFVGAMSPSLWFAQEAILPYVRQAEARSGLVHLDLGTHEGSDTRIISGATPRYTSRYLLAAHRMRELLDRKGYRLGHELHYHEEEEATHSEAAWARRLADGRHHALSRRGGGPPAASALTRRKRRLRPAAPPPARLVPERQQQAASGAGCERAAPTRQRARAELTSGILRRHDSGSLRVPRLHRYVYPTRADTPANCPRSARQTCSSSSSESVITRPRSASAKD